MNIVVDNPELLTVTEVSALLRLSQRTIYNHCKDGRIRHIRVGDRILIKRQTVDEILASDEPW